MQDEVRDFMIGFFKEKGLSDMDSETELLDINYLDKGIIDSFGIVEMIVGLEGEFGITFPSEEMQKEEFGTVGGLIGIVEALSKAKGG